MAADLYATLGVEKDANQADIQKAYRRLAKKLHPDLNPGNTAHFSDVDLARIRLIKDLKADFGVNDEGMAIILHLLDQLHGLRCLLRDIQAVIQAMGPLNRAKDVD